MTNNKMLSVLGICGSLRKQSYNKMLLTEAMKLAPQNMSFQVADIAPIPLYNQDVFDTGLPESVQTFTAQITKADALLIVSPEYNYSIPGVLKNAIDWASRISTKPLEKKPVALMGASMGNFGTVRMQMHLRQVFVFTNTFLLNKPEILVARAQEKFDAEGNLKDETTKKLISDLLIALAQWTQTLQSE